MSLRGLRRRSTASARRRPGVVPRGADRRLSARRAGRTRGRAGRAGQGAVGDDRRHASSTIRERKVVTAIGDVEISTGQRRLLADEVRYDQTTGKVFANGNVVLIEPSGDAMFGDEVELDDDFREGFATSVGVLLKDDSRIAGDARRPDAKATGSSSIAPSTRPARSARTARATRCGRSRRAA